MIHFAEINEVLSHYSILQHIGRVATPKLVPRNCIRYLQTTLIMWRLGSVPKFISAIIVTGTAANQNPGFQIYDTKFCNFFKSRKHKTP